MRDSNTGTAPKLNEAINACRSAADNASYQLLDIADAMSRLGMDGIARELTGIAERVVIGPREVSASYSVDLGNQVRHSEAMMNNLLKATLEGCIVPKPNKASPVEANP